MLPACAALALTAACVSALSPETTEAEDQAELARLEAEARALVDTVGCTQPGDCRSAPVGAKACGGPRTYVVYCASTTDTAALFRKLEQHRRAEAAFNRKYGRPSTCDVAMPPQTELAGGTCRARTR
jgi:hypothetical protein